MPHFQVSGEEVGQGITQRLPEHDSPDAERSNEHNGQRYHHLPAEAPDVKQILEAFSQIPPNASRIMPNLRCGVNEALETERGPTSLPKPLRAEAEWQRERYRGW